MTHNPSPDEMKQMVEAIFARTDQFRAAHDLDPPGDLTGFRELIRLIFSEDEAGLEIFAQIDSDLLDALWQMYQKRVLVEVK